MRDPACSSNSKVLNLATGHLSFFAQFTPGRTRYTSFVSGLVLEITHDAQHSDMYALSHRR